jgi:hypothetical protein
MNLWLFVLLIVLFAGEAGLYAAHVGKTREPIGHGEAAWQVIADILLILALVIWGGVKL